MLMNNKTENIFQTMISQISPLKPKNHIKNLSKYLSKITKKSVKKSFKKSVLKMLTKYRVGKGRPARVGSGLKVDPNNRPEF